MAENNTGIAIAFAANQLRMRGSCLLSGRSPEPVT